ncbi:MAG: DNA polymerase III subunit alpha [Proteobacteria bacterium]|nr:DNA polymerase III subunit alpha [Pseudomonadota bacterium]
MDLKILSQEIKSCKKCGLCESRKNVVVGRGSQTPKIVILGEAPGEAEDAAGKPFVGRSGMLLDRCISENGIKDFCILNILKCRPPENRKPTSEEIAACKPWLEQQLELLNPELIVCLGATALNFFFPAKKISEAIGQTLKDDSGRRFVGLYHPSYCLRGAVKIEDYVKSFERVNFFLEDGSTRIEAPAEQSITDPLPSPLRSPIPNGPQSTKPFPLGMQRYAPLHVHTEHGSVGDVFRTEDELAEDLSQKGFKACAITDHGSLSGLPYFQNALKKKGIKPIIGLEAYIEESEKKQSHLVLLVKNEIGYKNLLKLHTIAKEHVHKVFNKVFQKIPLDEVCKHSEGLICSTACISGTVAQRWKRGDDPEPIIQKLQAAFGEDLYMELMPNRMEEQIRFNEYIINIARKYNIKPIITTDSHYNSPEDKHYHDLVKANEWRKKITDKIGFSDDTFCNLTCDQIESLLKSNHPKIYPIREELFANTLEVASKCTFELPSNLGDTLPGNEEKARQKILDRIDVEGYTKKNGYDPQIVNERITKEIDLLTSRKFFNYFDKVMHMTDYADSHNIPRGPGRGSVGGSLLAYLLKITRVDPLRFNTLWERFLSPTRTPDIDMDFSAEKRGSIIGSLRLKYGPTNVSYIMTFNEWSDKSAIKDVARIYDVPLSEVNKFNKELSTKTAENLKIEDIILTSETAAEFAKKYPQVIDASIKLKGKIRHVGLHAAGVVICKDLESTIPTEIYDKGDIKNCLAASFEKDMLESLGIIKFDVLGISVLDVIDGALKSSGLEWDVLPEDYADPKIFELLKSSKTAGIFQFGSQLVTDYLRKLNPDKFNDLVAVNALCRPGPLNSGMSFDYVDRKGGKEWNYDHPTLESITKDTYGIICYQEQIMQIYHQIGNFSLVESEREMKLVAKSKGREALKESEDKMLRGALSNGFTKPQFDNLFNKILEFGRYSFNEAHSIEYSMLGYWTAWLKLYYPLAFYASLINVESDETQSLSFVKEAMDSGVEIKPPSVESPSELTTFNKDKNIIYLGLNKVKGIGPEEIKKVLAAGDDFDKIKKIKKNVYQTLVEVGYLDSVEKNRKQLLGGKELTRNTLWRWSTEPNTSDDWSEEEKMFRLRKSLPWPRSYDELPKTQYDLHRKPLNYLKSESVENKAILSVGWVYDHKAFSSNGNTSYVLNFEDGTSRVTLNLSAVVARRHKEIVDTIVKGEQKNPLVFCLNPYYMNRGHIEVREGKLQILWMGNVEDEMSKNVLRGLEGGFDTLGAKEFLITNISYGTSKAGNAFSSIECVDNVGQITYGAMMSRGGLLPMYGSIIRGKWNATAKGTFWNGE